MKKLLIITFIILFSSTAYAACTGSTPTWEVTTPYGFQDMQDCIDDASDGDTINFPATSVDVTWNTGVIIPNTKGVLIMGAGVGTTKITGTADTKFTIQIASTNAYHTRISGIEFYTAVSGDHAISIVQTVKYGTQSTGRYRIDNCKFDAHPGVTFSGNAFGVMDNCTMAYASGYNSVALLWIDGKTGVTTKTIGTGGDMGWQSWEEGVYWESQYFHVVEDCDFDFTTMGSGPNWIDGNSGGKISFRHCTFMNASIPGGHDACTAGTRGHQAVLLHDNAFKSDEHNWTMNNNRGGAWLVYDNTFQITSLTMNPLMFTNPIYRYPSIGGCGGIWASACDSTGVLLCEKELTTCVTTANCSTEPNDECVEMDGNDYPCRDQIGQVDNDRTVVPFVSWNNLWCEGSDSCSATTNIGFSIYATNDADFDVIELERDVIDDCTGDSGLPVCEDTLDNDSGGGGADASDSNCSTYWDPTNDMLNNYTELAYPHPLRTSGSIEGKSVIGGGASGGGST